MAWKTLKPAVGLQVRKPTGSHLAPEGEPVEMTSYWLRRLNDGDVVEVIESTDKPKAAKLAAIKE